MQKTTTTTTSTATSTYCKNCSKPLRISDEHIQRVQNELQPLRKQIADLEQSVRESKQKVNRTKAEVVAALTPVRSSFRGEPRARDVVNVLQTTRYQLNQLETAGAVTRPPIIQNGPPARIRQYIKGKEPVLLLHCESSEAQIALFSKWNMLREWKLVQRFTFCLSST